MGKQIADLAKQGTIKRFHSISFPSEWEGRYKGYDHSKKVEAYRTIPTFEEYLLLNKTRIYIEHFSKTDNKRWSFCEYDESDNAIAFSSVSLEISLANIYNVNFEQVDAETTPEAEEL